MNQKGCGPTLLIGLFLFVCTFPCVAQEPKANWERIFTGDDIIIEVNSSSLTFLENRVLRVSLRTVYKKQQSLPGQANTKYKSQVEIIELNLDGKNYRPLETRLLDESGQVVVVHRAPPNDAWRVMRPGGMMQKLFDSLRSLAPFGYWKIIGLRYSAEGGGRTFERLQGTRVILLPERAEVRSQNCSAPHYVSESMSKEEFERKLGITLESLNINSAPVNAVVIKCTIGSWEPQQSLLLKLSDDRMLILWEGLFLELKRD